MAFRLIIDGAKFVKVSTMNRLTVSIRCSGHHKTHGMETIEEQNEKAQPNGAIFEVRLVLPFRYKLHLDSPDTVWTHRNIDSCAIVSVFGLLQKECTAFTHRHTHIECYRMPRANCFQRLKHENTTTKDRDGEQRTEYHRGKCENGTESVRTRSECRVCVCVETCVQREDNSRRQFKTITLRRIVFFSSHFLVRHILINGDYDRMKMTLLCGCADNLYTFHLYMYVLCVHARNVVQCSYICMNDIIQFIYSSSSTSFRSHRS